MVKKILVFLSVALLSCTAFAACAQREPNPGGEGGGGTAPHSVTVEEPFGVELSASVSSASAGVSVVVTAEPAAWRTVESVSCNGTPCTKNADGTYSFTMPDENVTVTAEVKDSGEDVDEDDGMTWVFAPSEIAPYEYGDQTFEVDFGSSPVNISANEDDGMLYAKVTSTNPDAIPAEAISKVEDTIGDFESTSGFTQGATFSVDLSKVSLGSTTLVFEDTDHDRTIAKYVTVTEYGTIVPGNVQTAELEIEYDFNVSRPGFSGNVDLDKVVIIVNVSDQDYIYGTDPDSGCVRYQEGRFLLSNDGEKSMTVNLIEGHRYMITAAAWQFTNTMDDEAQGGLTQIANGSFVIGDYTGPGFANSIEKDEDGRAWLNVTNFTQKISVSLGR